MQSAAEGQAELKAGTTSQRSAWPERVTAIGTMLLAFIGMFALLFSYVQIEESRRISAVQLDESRHEAQIQHLHEVVSELDGPAMHDLWKALALKRVDQKKHTIRALDVDDPPREMYDILNFFEYVSLLANRGYLDKEDVWDQLGDWMLYFYADAKPLIESEQRADRAMYTDFTQLVEYLKRVENAKSGGVLNHPSTDDMYGFYSVDVNSTLRMTRRPAKRRVPLH